jgi:tetratricopeptide (TPR) repeat protein
MNKTFFIIAIASILVIGCLFFVYRFFLYPTKITVATPQNISSSLHYELVSEIPEYGKAAERMGVRDYIEAEKLYRSALEKARDPKEYGQILYKVGTALYAQGKYLDAVDVFKEVATLPEYEKIGRAYAVMQLGQIYSQTNDDLIWSQIVSTEPFASLNVGSRQASLVALYKYSATLYPLAISELRVAHGLAQEVNRLSHRSTRTEADEKKLNEYLQEITLRTSRADADIERTQDDKNANGLIPSALLRKAMIFSELAFAGYIEHSVAIDAFEKAQNAWIASGGNDSFLRLRYAEYLLTLDSELYKTNIQQLLQPIVVLKDGHTGNPPILVSLKNLRGKPQEELSKTVRTLALEYSDFRELLLTVGWKESDF